MGSYHRQYADRLTKTMRNVLWENYCETQMTSMKETAEARLEEHRKGLCRAQRQRRKAKFRKTTAQGFSSETAAVAESDVNTVF